MPRQRSSKSFFIHLLENAKQEIYCLDNQNRIRFCSLALLNWLGLPVEQLLDRHCSATATPLDSTQESLVRGLGVLPENESKPNFFQTIFFARPGQPPEFRGAEFRHISAPDGFKGWIVFVTPEPVPHQPSKPEESLIAELAKIAHAWLPARLPPIATGNSVIARRLRRQLELAITAQLDVSFEGAEGSGTEQLARFVFRQFPQSESQTLTPIRCAVADQVSIQETLRRLSRPVGATYRDRSSISDWLLLLDVHRLDPLAAMELDGFLELPHNRIRILATYSKELVNVQQSFPASFFSRLTTQVINLQPLKSRLEDLPYIFRLLVEDLASAGSLAMPALPTSTIEAILEYDWPNDYRELQQAVEAFFASPKVGQGSSSFLTDDLPDKLRQSIRHGRLARGEPQIINLDQRLNDLERDFLVRALKATKFNRSKACKLLGISRARLLRRCEQLGIEFPGTPIDFKLVEPIDRDDPS